MTLFGLGLTPCPRNESFNARANSESGGIEMDDAKILEEQLRIYYPGVMVFATGTLTRDTLIR
jgi:hypothetical protein